MPDPQSAPRHPVRLVAARTGLSPHVLRAWERRYHVVTPGRSEGGQRLYSDLDIARLRLLRRLTELGHGIGGLARLPVEELEELAREAAPVRPEPGGPPSPGELREAALAAVRRLDAGELHAVLERAAVTVGVSTFLDTVAGPALQAIGEGWRAGTLTVAHEHLASAVFRRVLGWIVGMHEVNASAPRLVVATPPRQRHELGALLAAAAAAAEGWGVTYLGADLPVRDILAAARQVGARAVALSLVYPDEDPLLAGELEELRRELPPGTAVLVGGSAVLLNRPALERVGARVVATLADLRLVLRELAAAPEAA